MNQIQIPKTVCLATYVFKSLTSISLLITFSLGFFLFTSAQSWQKFEIANHFELQISFHLVGEEVSSCSLLTGHAID